MKAVPSSVSASKAASRARSRLPASTCRLPHHIAVIDSAGPRNVAPTYGRGVTATNCTNHRILPQHIRRSSGSRPCILDAKVNKSVQRTRIGLWLDNVHGCDALETALANTPACPSPRRRQSAPNTPSLESTQVIRKAGSPRMPLADITPLVLGAESASGHCASDSADVDLPPQPPSPRVARDLAGAIMMLTADEARQLLLLSAQSNMPLAAAIKEVAIARTPRPPTSQIQHSYLADTFRFDEPQSNV